MSDIVIVSGARTPMGGFQGSLSSVPAVELGALAIREAVARAGIQPADVQEVIMGCVLPAGLKQGPARQASLGAGLPAATGCTTINKLCGSGMKAVMQAFDALKAGSNDVMVAGGMENMSMAPYYLPKARFGYRMGDATMHDHMVHDGLWDIVNDFHMGISNELCSERYQVSREDQDRYAAESYRRTLAAQEAALVEAVEAYFPVGTRLARPEGGYFLWVELPRRVDALALHRQALAQGISLAPGPIFSAKREFGHCIRLNFGHPIDDRARDAVRALGQLLAEQGGDGSVSIKNDTG